MAAGRPTARAPRRLVHRPRHARRHAEGASKTQERLRMIQTKLDARARYADGRLVHDRRDVARLRREAEVLTAWEDLVDVLPEPQRWGSTLDLILRRPAEDPARRRRQRRRRPEGSHLSDDEVIDVVLFFLGNGVTWNLVARWFEVSALLEHHVAAVRRRRWDTARRIAGEVYAARSLPFPLPHSRKPYMSASRRASILTTTYWDVAYAHVAALDGRIRRCTRASTDCDVCGVEWRRRNQPQSWRHLRARWSTLALAEEPAAAGAAAGGGLERSRPNAKAGDRVRAPRKGARDGGVFLALGVVGAVRNGRCIVRFDRGGTAKSLPIEHLFPVPADDAPPAALEADQEARREGRLAIISEELRRARAMAGTRHLVSTGGHPRRRSRAERDAGAAAASSAASSAVRPMPSAAEGPFTSGAGGYPRPPARRPVGPFPPIRIPVGPYFDWNAEDPEANALLDLDDDAVAELEEAAPPVEGRWDAARARWRRSEEGRRRQHRGRANLRRGGRRETASARAAADQARQRKAAKKRARRRGWAKKKEQSRRERRSKEPRR